MPIELALPWYAIVVPVVIGVAAAVVAALAPVRRAGKVSPLAALQPDAGLDVASRAGKVRIALGTLMTVARCTPLLAVVAGYDSWLGSPLGFLAAVAAGACSFIGVALLGTVLFPSITAALGSVVALPARMLRAGVPVELAVENTARNPRRTAATASALLVGVTLIVTTLVGAASGRATVTDELDRSFPIDAVVAAEGRPMTDGEITSLTSVPGVTESATLGTTQIRIGTRERTVTVLDPQVRSVMRDAARTAGLADGTILADEEALRASGLTAGQRITVSGPNGSRELTVAAGEGLGLDQGTGGELAVTSSDARAVTGTVTRMGVLMRFDDDARSDTVLNGLLERAPEDASVGGAAPQRAEIGRIIDMMVMVAAGLLAMSVVIALVGVANTLSLSAIERTRESGLLRALGLTRGQLRAGLAVEGTLLAVGGALVGAGLGVLYGCRSFGNPRLGLRHTRLGLARVAAILRGDSRQNEATVPPEPEVIGAHVRSRRHVPHRAPATTSVHGEQTCSLCKFRG